MSESARGGSSRTRPGFGNALAPENLLTAGILVFAALGAYAVAGSIADLAIAVACRLGGFLMRRAGYPVAPMVLGVVVVGPLMEMQFRRALAFSEGDPTPFITRPISLAILLLAVFFLVGPVLVRRRQARTREPGTVSAG
ncbi:MAG: hypothetical protein GEV11_30065 [Streptosporangiales bacterium]|nr:hypothetical protein [Streptosporangiales bacterium]